MKIFKGICFVSILSISLVAAQGPDTLWTKVYGGIYDDISYRMDATSDGGYIIAGETKSFGTNGDAWLVKIDSRGDTLWTRTFGDFYWDRFTDVQETNDGGYIATGVITTHAPDYDVLLVKVKANGDTGWIRTYGDSLLYDGGVAVRQTVDGGYIIAGGMYLATGDKQYLLVRTDSLGDTLWTKIFGGPGYDFFNSVEQTSEGGYIATGKIDGGNVSSPNIYLAKFNSDGDTLWTKSYGGIAEENSFVVQQTSDKGYIICGYTRSYGAGGADVYLIRTDSLGDTLWTKTYGGADDDYGGYTLHQATSGFVLTGWTRSFGSGGFDIWLLKTNSNGDTLWTKTYGGLSDDYGRSVQPTPDGGYIIAGETNSFGAGRYDLYLVRTKPDTLGIDESQHSRPRCLSFEVFPNPIKEECHVRYTLLQKSRINLSLYDVTGRLVKEIINENQDRGSYYKTVNMTALPQGVYFFRLNTQKYSDIKKIIHIK